LQNCIKGFKGTFLENGREDNENCFDVCGSKALKDCRILSLIPEGGILFSVHHENLKSHIGRCERPRGRLDIAATQHTETHKYFL
jgi:hypothetical protein